MNPPLSPLKENWVPCLVCMGDIVLFSVPNRLDLNHMNMEILRGLWNSSSLFSSAGGLCSLFCSGKKLRCGFYSWERKSDSSCTEPTAMFSTPLSFCNAPPDKKPQRNLSEKSICLLGQWGRRGVGRGRGLRENPCHYHFRSCHWQEVTLCGYSSSSLCSTQSERFLNCALRIHSHFWLRCFLFFSFGIWSKLYQLDLICS